MLCDGDHAGVRKSGQSCANPVFKLDWVFGRNRSKGPCRDSKTPHVLTLCAFSLDKGSVEVRFFEVTLQSQSASDVRKVWPNHHHRRPPPPRKRCLDNVALLLVGARGRRARERTVPQRVRDTRGTQERTVLSVTSGTQQRPVRRQRGPRTVRARERGRAAARAPVPARRTGRSGAVAHPVLQQDLSV